MRKEEEGRMRGEEEEEGRMREEEKREERDEAAAGIRKRN